MPGRFKRALKSTLKWTGRTLAVGGTVAVIGLSGKAYQIELNKYDELAKKGIPIANQTRNNQKGYCAGYAKDVALQISKKTYPIGSAWELPARTIVTFKKNFDPLVKKGGFEKKELSSLIKERKISRGTLIGCYYTESHYNSPNRPFTHILVYLGGDKFAHNITGPEVITLDKIYSGGKLFPICVMEPKP